MLKLKLPPELVSLIHHIELNKSGWWEQATQRLILAVIWLSSKHLTVEGVVKSLKDNFQVNLDVEKVISQIKKLVSSNELVELTEGKFKISESALKRLDHNLREAEEDEKQARATFLRIFKKNCPSLKAEKEWENFNGQLLLPSIQKIGANTYQFIIGEKKDLGGVQFNKFLEKYQPEIRESYKTAVRSFLDPEDRHVRLYVLRLLNAFFLLESSSLKKETLEALEKTVGSRPSFNIFVDTNFLFSILGLHDNPSNEAALLLTALIKKITRSVDLKLYASTLTVAETRGTLAAIGKDLSQIRLTSNMAEAALEMGKSGIPQNFLEDAAKSRSPIEAAAYFDPYLKNTVSILRSKGIELFNEKMDSLKKRKDVMSDIGRQLEHEEERYGEEAKSYEQLEHDVVLWHFVNERRPPEVESPLQACYWIITVDYRFLGFDSFKKSESGGVIPLCLHPTTLAQMLQFWVPRTPEFEGAILGSIRLPFLFLERDVETERASIDILKTLGRFENVGDLPRETITAILLNDVLRRKIVDEPEVDKKIKLIREVLISETQRAKKELDGAREKQQRLIQDKEEVTEDLQRRLDETKGKLHDAESEIQEREKKQTTLENRVNRLEKALEIRDKEERDERLIREFNIKSFWLPLPLGVTMLFVFKKASDLLSWHLDTTLLLALLLLFSLAWVRLIDRRGAKNSVIKKSKPFLYIHKIKRLIFIVKGMIPNALWDAFKSKLKLGW